MSADDEMLHRLDGITKEQLPRITLDVTVETTAPIAIGWAWRPVRGAQAEVEVTPAGPFVFGPNSVTWPSGQLYAAYSPDGAHWSTWQPLAMQEPNDRNHPRQVYTGLLSVPRQASKRYAELVQEYARMDVPWKSDEEAAVRWILQKEPDFFTKNMPFIGYVRFLYEVGLRGDQRLEKIKFTLHYGASGLAHEPKDARAEKKAAGPWKFKAEAK